MNRIRTLAITAILISLTACVTQPAQYDWADYETGLYNYYKDPTKLDAYMEKLADATRQGEIDGHIAPGLHAEYGYVLMTQGKSADAISEFNAEKKRFPESTVLMDRMVTLANGKAIKTSNASPPTK